MRTATYLGSVWAFLTDVDHDWDAEADRIDSVPHYGIEFEESEGEHPALDIKFENQGGSVRELVDGNPRILLSVDVLDQDGERMSTVLLFDGLIDDTGDVEFGDDDIAVHYEAIRENWEALEASVLNGLGLPIADPCAGDMTDPTERLDALPALVHWSRLNRMPTLGSIFGDGQRRVIGSNFEQGSFRIRRQRPSLARVDVVITAPWIQSIIQEDDFGALMAQAFGGYGMSTYTPFTNLMPVGSSIGDGYVVTESDLRYVAPPQGYEAAAIVHDQLVAAGNAWRGGDSVTTTRFKRFWFDLKVRAIGTSAIKRTEIARFSVYNGGQNPGVEVVEVPIKLDRLSADPSWPEFEPDGHEYRQNDLVRSYGFTWRCTEDYFSGSSLLADRIYRDEFDNRVVRWEIQPYDGSPLGSPAALSFFSTERGRKTIDHGILVAIKHHAYRQRNWEAEFKVDALQVLDISCRDTIEVVSDRVPSSNKTVIGKVKAYSFDFSGQNATCTITISISSGSGLPGASGARNVAPYNNAVFQVGYTPPAYSAPYAPRLGVVGVEVNNPPEVQEQLMAAAMGSAEDAFELLRDNPTQIAIKTVSATGGETLIDLPFAVSAYQGFKGIQL